MSSHALVDAHRFELRVQNLFRASVPILAYFALICATASLAEALKLKIVEARAHPIAQSELGYVEFELSDDSQRLLSRLMQDNLGKTIEFKLGNQVVKSRINTPMFAKIISFSNSTMSDREARELAADINSGKATLEIDIVQDADK